MCTVALVRNRWEFLQHGEHAIFFFLKLSYKIEMNLLEDTGGAGGRKEPK